MADMPVERKTGGGMGWMGWLIGALVVAGLIWVLVEAFDSEPDTVTDLAEVEAVEPITPATTPEMVATGEAVTIGDILGNPAGYIGQQFPQAEVKVIEVPTDRGFWIEDEGQRLFAILIDNPVEQPVDINTGQTLRVDQGMLRDRTFLPQIPGEPLDADTQRIAEEQDIFLVVDEQYINILDRPGGS